MPLIQEKKIGRKFEKLLTYDLSYFIGKSHFGDNRLQNYSIFQYFKLLVRALMFKLVFQWK